MNEVDAVKTKEEIALVQTLLNKHGSEDMADIWKLGINVALRITDLLAVQFDQINMNKRELELMEQKTGKKRTVRLNDAAYEIVQRRRAAFPDDTYLFQSHSNRAKTSGKPLDRSSVARKFQEIGNIIDVKLGTHSMRKTRGYMMFKAGVSLAQIARVLNHSTPAVTMAYIGLTKEETLQTYDDFVL